MDPGTDFPSAAPKTDSDTAPGAALVGLPADGRFAQGRFAQGRFAHADSHFRMGSGHDADGSPCQDYATSGMARGLPFAVISDGCSTAGRTDLGARVLALSAARALRDGGDLGLGPLLRRALVAASASAMSLGASSDDMAATLGLAFALPGGGARAILAGDGVIAARTAGGLDVRIVDWAGNMPAYPWYLRSPTARDAFAARSRLFAAEAGRAPCRISRFRIGADGAPERIGLLELDVGLGMAGLSVDWAADEAPDALAVLSDGALQFADAPLADDRFADDRFADDRFADAQSAGQPAGTAAWPLVVAELTAFKAAREGEFVRRRVSRALAFLAGRGLRPADDVAVAAIAAASQAGG